VKPPADLFDEQEYLDSVKQLSRGKISKAQHGEVVKRYEAAKASGKIKRVQQAA
jgi:hypothetical protein